MNRKTLKKGIGILLLIGVLAFGVVGDSWSGMSAQAVGPLDCKVMPLGDSITVGKYSGNDTSNGADSDDIGYRKDLHDLLVGAGYNVDFVGTQSNGSTYPFSDPQHEGHNGWADYQIADNIYNDGGENWLLQNPADVIFLHIGTNNPRDPAEVERILDEIDAYQADTGSKVIVIIARIIGTVADGSSAFSGYNDSVEDLVTVRSDYGTELFLVDMEGIAGWNYSIYPGDPTGDMIDNLHPYATGYTKMAAVWFAKYDDVFGSAGSNAAPNVTNPGTRSSTEGDTVSLQISASDPDVESITYTAYNLPSGLNINPATGLISGTIDSSASSGSPYGVDIVVADGNLCGSSSVSFTWNVSESNLPPEIEQPANQENVEGDSISLQISATDPNGDDLTYSAPNLPGDLSINQSGLISGVISFDASGGSPYTVGVTVEDDGTPNLSDSVSFTWTVNDYVPSPPDVTNPGPQSDYEGAALSLQIVASDPNGDPMTYAATGLPTGLSIAVDTGLISGKVGAGASGSSPYAVTVTVTDDNDNETPVEFVWTINPNAIPVITPISNQTTEQGDAVSLQVNANDGDADPLTYAALNLPPGLTINASSGLISGTVSMSAVVGVAYNVTVTVDDSKASPVTTVFNWTITSNRPPVVVQPANQVNVEGATVSLQVVASDPDEDTLTYSAIGLPPGLSINPTSGLISGVIAAGAGDFSPYTVKVKATDPKLLYDEKQFSWMVATDNSPPNVTNPGDQTNNKGDNVSLQIEATDPDGDSLEYSAFGLPSGLSINFSTGLISGVINSIASYFSPYNVTVSVDDGINDPVQAMFNWTIESPINNIYLPMVFGNPCSNFFDDFSNPNSGWAIGEDEDFSYGYFGGEYRVLSKNDLYGYLFGAPTCARENYTVEVDARWVEATGERYGILFGIIGDFDQFYQFDVNTDYQVYRIIFFNGIDYQYIVPQSYLPFINGGTSSNHLKITRIKNQISIDVNGNALGSWTDRNITGETYTGITSTPYIGYPISDARFDNFSVTQVNNLTQSSAIVRKSAGNFIPPRIYKLTPNREVYSTHSIQFMH